MDFNVEKCKLMRITMKKQPFISNFTLKGSVLEEADEFRDLGFLTNDHLSWNSHIDTITSKDNRILGLIKRTCRGWKDFVLHTSEIASGVWIGVLVALYFKKY